jgi:bifunctional N-acetylglucosamine-1-phosphate-uridyltransferase/glucosamine-1-phosphate-acetyltransferase GlmU-like protein
MAKKFLLKSHIIGADGALLTPETVVESSALGDGETIKRYLDLEAIAPESEKQTTGEVLAEVEAAAAVLPAEEPAKKPK